MAIPRRLIRTVPAETDPQVDAWWNDWRELHPGWDSVTYREPIDPDLFPQTAEHWDRCTSGAQRAGLIRLEALWNRGGIYLDSDVQPLGRSLAPLLWCSAFAAWEDPNTIPDAVLGAEAKHPAILDCLRAAIVNLPCGAHTSGPGITTKILRGRVGNVHGHHDVLLLPPGTFYGVHYNDGIAHANDEALDAFAADPPPWAFGLHRWHGSWLAEQGHGG